jgi:hypothetical protein
LWALLVVGGCGRLAFDPIAADSGDGDRGDAPRPACTAFTPWSAPVIVPGLDTPAADDSGGQVSPDGLALYYARDNHLRVARRADRTSPWATSLIAELDGPVQYDPTVTGDELELFFTRDAGAFLCIYSATRTARTMPWSTPVRLDELCSGRDAGGAYVTADGLTLYYTPVVSAGEGSIYVTTRPDRATRFQAGQPIAGLPGATVGSFGYAALSADQLTIYFESTIAGTLDIYEATRSSLAEPFSAATPVPMVNTAARDEDVSITADGLELYFDSDRAGQSQDVYVLTRSCI